MNKRDASSNVTDIAKFGQLTSRPRTRQKPVPRQQLSLPMPELQDYGLQVWHSYPWVAGEDKVARFRLPADQAWSSWPYVEPNPPTAWALCALDIDHADTFEYASKTPVPNFMVRTDQPPYTYHVVYTLETPVARSADAKIAPLAYYRRVQMGLTDLLGADVQYNGAMIKNPIAPPEGCQALWVRRAPYTLAELLEWLPDETGRPVVDTGEGRNVTLFRHAVSVAHQPKWARIIGMEGHAGQFLEYVRRQNVAEFAEWPLPDSECRSIAKSCAKYAMRQWSETAFSERQMARITQRWHDSAAYDYAGRRATVADLVSLGYRQAEVSALMGVSIRTVKRDLRTYRLRDPSPGDNAGPPGGSARVDTTRVRGDIP